MRGELVVAHGAEGVRAQPVAQLGIDGIATGFAIGLQLAAPFLIYGVALLIAAGLPEAMVGSVPPPGVGADDHLDALAGEGFTRFAFVDGATTKTKALGTRRLRIRRCSDGRLSRSAPGHADQRICHHPAA